jgi:hypothetical protein
MASGISQFTVALMLNKLLRGVAGTWPTTVYIGLFTSTPSDSGGGTECSGSGYARQAITVGTGVFAAVSAGSTTNSNLIDFGTASGAVGTVTQFGIFDALTTGNLLAWGDLTASQVVANGNAYNIAIGAMGIGII